ncbi:MAG: DUF2309 family protein [Candidatus Wallbacteria bacterium]|nr:DUF2309 family protein [Candidatus Wallbacteria bacterium]
MNDSQAASRLESALEHAAHLLPAQGPISVFVHHNTLHAFERMPFDTAVVEAAELYGTSPFLPEGKYRQELGRGRILRRDLLAVLDADLGPEAAGEPIAGVPRRELRMAVLVNGLDAPRGRELGWLLEETDVLRRPLAGLDAESLEKLLDSTRRWFLAELAGRGPAAMATLLTGEADPGRAARALALELGIGPRRGDLEQLIALQAGQVAARTLWHASVRACGRVPYSRSVHEARSPRPRDLLYAATGQDPDELVDPLMIRLAASFLDQGLSYWPMPDRDQGFWRGALGHLSQPAGSPESWQRALPGEASRLLQSGVDAVGSAIESLDLLGVEASEWSDFTARTLLPLRGWAGMFHQLEERPDRVPAHAPPARLADFLAVRLLLDRLAAEHVSGAELGDGYSAARLLAILDGRQSRGPTREERAFALFQVAQLVGLAAGDIDSMERPELVSLLDEIEWFDELERRRHFHLAYERRYREGVLEALAARVPASRANRGSEKRLQVICCLDEREESLRRHLEEAEPECETFGTAGFFGVAMYYRGILDAFARPLCPIVIRPGHLVTEQLDETLEDEHRRKTLVRRVLGRLRSALAVSSRTLARGTLLTAALGTLAALPLVLRVLFPRIAAWLRKRGQLLTRTRGRTRLAVDASEAPALLPGTRVGFTVAEQADIVGRLLEELGIAGQLRTSGPGPARTARLVLVLGHGSSSLNNPHQAAYDCGACGGGRGGANARAFAQMANDPRVRELLAARGLTLPADTRFVGAQHDTCEDAVYYYDLDGVGEEHAAELRLARHAMARALAANAHERCRRFESAPLWLEREDALAHVEGRAQDLAQPRPELGHATNATLVVGRRELTRGLFLDRRAFLASYDPHHDSDGTVLSRILHAVLPVCAGINLEYYFSRVDPTGFGCGTKLPHNIVSMLGVMDGHASDLRAGLPWQMVEIHEPMRLLTVVESPTERILGLMGPRDPLRRLVANRWIQLVALDPNSGRMHLFGETGFQPFEPPAIRLARVSHSFDWYRMRRDSLSAALVERPELEEGGAAWSR